MEDFYAAAREADYLIYNSTVGGELKTIDQLLGKSELLEDFKACKVPETYIVREKICIRKRRRPERWCTICIRCSAGRKTECSFCTGWSEFYMIVRQG